MQGYRFFARNPSQCFRELEIPNLRIFLAREIFVISIHFTRMTFTSLGILAYTNSILGLPPGAALTEFSGVEVFEQRAATKNAVHRSRL